MHATEVYIDTGELLFVGLPFAIVVGWLSGRVLGVRRGWVRAFVAGLAGWLFGLVVAATIQDTDDLGETWFLTFAFGLLAAMVVSVVLDVVLRPREQRAHRRLRWLVHPIRAVKRVLAPFGRFREIVHHAPQARSHRSAVRIDDRHGHAGVRPPAAAHAGGLRRDVREVRPDRLDPHRPPAPRCSRPSCPTCRPPCGGCRPTTSGR